MVTSTRPFAVRQRPHRANLRERPQRFRLIYRQLDDVTLEIVAIGPRDEHAIYRAAAQRLTP